MGEGVNGMEDRHIVALFFDRAEGAIDALAKKYGRALYSLCRNILNDPQDADECVSDAYLAAWNTIPPASPQPLSAYIYKLGRNCALKKLRARTAQKRTAYEVSLDELAEVLPGGDVESAVEAKLLGEAIDRYLDTLTKENRVIFLRRYWFGDNLREIARRTGVTENALAVRLSRLRAGLKDFLTREGIL